MDNKEEEEGENDFGVDVDEELQTELCKLWDMSMNSVKDEASVRILIQNLCLDGCHTWMLQNERELTYVDFFFLHSILPRIFKLDCLFLRVTHNLCDAFYTISVSISVQEVVQFLHEFKAVEIFIGVIGKSKAPRVTVSMKYFALMEVYPAVIGHLAVFFLVPFGGNAS